MVYIASFMDVNTRATLLERLRVDSDANDWEQFYRQYWALIINFVTGKGCSRHLAEDVLQEVMVRLMRVLPRFQYDTRKGAFRSFLLTVVRNVTVDVIRREAKYVDISSEGERRTDWFGRLPGGEDDDWEEQWDRQWHQNLLRQALERVQKKVSPQTFKSFRLSVLEERPVDEVCRELGLSRNVVYQHRARLTNMLEREINQLKAEIGEPDV